KKMDDEAVRAFRDRFKIPIDDDQLKDGAVPFFHPGEDSEDVQYMRERRKALGGFLPQRRVKASESLPAPKMEVVDRLLKDTDERQISAPRAFVQALGSVLRDKGVAPRGGPIVGAEGRTFGMQRLFRQIGIYEPQGH